MSVPSTGQVDAVSVRSTDRADAARARISAWLADHGRFAGLVLTTPGAVAWATGGVAPPVDRTASTDLVWAVFTRTGAGLITTVVEADRVRDEYGPERHGFAELLEDRFLLGSPTEVADQMIRLNRRLGVNHIVASVHWPGMPNSLALDQLQILAEEVMPQVRAAL